ncbi:MAG: class I SAM-dependent methyltransferase [Candidatus Dechloromonas phosphoritropha]
MTASPNEHPAMIAPSPWVVCHLPLVAVGGRVLDLACGRGRHARLLAAAGYEVVAVDRDFAAISSLQKVAGITALRFDLEGGDWPLAGERFAGVIVTNYLWRPRLPDVCALVGSGGVLIYETFMVGNEVYGKPSTPDFLLRHGELRAVVRAAGLCEIAVAEGYTDSPKPGMRQAVCAVRE